MNDWIRNNCVLFKKPRQIKNERSDYRFTVSARRNKIDARAVASEKNVQPLKKVSIGEKMEMFNIYIAHLSIWI